MLQQQQQQATMADRHSRYFNFQQQQRQSQQQQVLFPIAGEIMGMGAKASGEELSSLLLGASSGIRYSGSSSGSGGGGGGGTEGTTTSTNSTTSPRTLVVVFIDQELSCLFHYSGNLVYSGNLSSL